MDEIDWDSLTFSLTKTDWMYMAKCKLGDAWTPGKIMPYGSFEIDPAAGVLNYGQGIFEGLKAYHTQKDRIVLFRPNKNSARMQKSTERMCIPVMNDQYFMDAVTSTVKDNADFIPPFGKGSLYIRPICFGVSKRKRPLIKSSFSLKTLGDVNLLMKRARTVKIKTRIISIFFLIVIRPQL